VAEERRRQGQAGDVIAEIETDKATMEVEAVDEGVLGKILVAAGTEGVKVNTPIAVCCRKAKAPPISAARRPASCTAAPGRGAAKAAAPVASKPRQACS
jgi:pyruvate/2-oxoglutarate dehydrogenase complex dihydrolipoamide acyltransferase (E2) component